MKVISATKCRCCNGQKHVGSRMDDCRQCKGEGFVKVDGNPVPAIDVYNAYHGKVEIVIDGAKLEPKTTY